jgi:hypothetical protein
VASAPQCEFGLKLEAVLIGSLAEGDRNLGTKRGEGRARLLRNCGNSKGTVSNRHRRHNRVAGNRDYRDRLAGDNL